MGYLRFKIIIIFSLFYQLIFLNANVIRPNDGEYTHAKGPLQGKNIFTNYFIFSAIPGLTARAKEPFTFTYSLSMYYTNDFSCYFIYDKDSFNYDGYITYDYESIIFEWGTALSVTDRIEFGSFFRFVGYYGGFMDEIVEWFHTVTALPNGGREYFEQNAVSINMLTHNNLDIHMEGSQISLGDIDLWMKYHLYHNKFIDLSAYYGFKIPTGQLDKASGSGYPDLSTALLFEFHPHWIFSFHIQQGVVIPFQMFFTRPGPYPMYNGIFSLELGLAEFVSIIAQFNVKSSPVVGTYLYVNNLDIKQDFLSSPQTNILVGIVFKYDDIKLQLYFEEDAFTNAGTDWTFNIMLEHKLIVKK